MNKIETIIAALQFASDNSDKTNFEYHIVEKALAAARELKAMKPVGWVTKDAEDVVDKFRLQHFKNGIPVYALDGVKHD